MSKILSFESTDKNLLRELVVAINKTFYIRWGDGSNLLSKIDFIDESTNYIILTYRHRYDMDFRLYRSSKEPHGKVISIHNDDFKKTLFEIYQFMESNNADLLKKIVLDGSFVERNRFSQLLNVHLPNI